MIRDVSGRVRRHAHGRGRTFLEGPKTKYEKSRSLFKTYVLGADGFSSLREDRRPLVHGPAESTGVGWRKPGGLVCGWFFDGFRWFWGLKSGQKLVREPPEGFERGQDGAVWVAMGQEWPKVGARCGNCGQDASRKAKIGRRETPRTTNLSEKSPKVAPKW